MPQDSGSPGWGLDDWDKEAEAMKARLAELTKDGRMSGGGAMYRIQREDNEAVVKMRLEAAKEKPTPEVTPPVEEQESAPADQEQSRTLKFFEDREPQGQNYNSLKREHAVAERADGEGEQEKGADREGKPAPEVEAEDKDKEQEQQPDMDDRTRRFMEQMERNFSRDDRDERSR